MLFYISHPLPALAEQKKTKPVVTTANNGLSDLVTSLDSRLIISQMEGARDELQNGEMWES